MRKLVTIRTISEIKPIEGADRLEIARIDGWQCIVRKGQFKTGEKAVYFEIDSALPPEDERYEFLKSRCLKVWKIGNRLIDSCLRIRTIRLKGVISQGLLMPLSNFPEFNNATDETDLTALLKVRHYDELHERSTLVTGKARISVDVKGDFPSFVPKTDEERLQNLPEYFEIMKGIPFECTEKYDGSSMTVAYNPIARPDDPYYVCSRNLEVKDTNENTYWEVAKKYDMLEKLKELNRPLALQGELVGPGINANRDEYTEHEFRLFRIYDIEKGEWLTPDDRAKIASLIKIPHVRVLKKDWFVFDELTTMDDFLFFVDGCTEHGLPREGCVFKSLNGCVSFKVINNNYLLREN